MASAFGFINKSNKQVKRKDLFSSEVVEPLHESSNFSSFVNQTPHASFSFGQNAQLEHSTFENIQSNRPLFGQNVSSRRLSFGQNASSGRPFFTQNVPSKRHNFRQSTQPEEIVFEHFGGPSFQDFKPRALATASKDIINTTENSTRQKKYRWETFQEKKKFKRTHLQGLYSKQQHIHEQIQKIKQKLDHTLQLKQDAIEKEQFLSVRDFQKQADQYKKQLDTLANTNLHDIQSQIRSAWKEMAEILAEEPEKSNDMVDILEEEKKKRQQIFDQYTKKIDQQDAQLLEGIKEKRQDIESQKSEIALDLELWDRSDAELQERMYETVLEETEKKNELEKMTNQIQDEINELLEKVKALEQEKKKYKDTIAKLDEAIETKLKPVKKERREHEQELELIKKRQKELNEKSAQLDKEDARINIEIERHSQEKSKGLKELEELERNIAFVASRQLNGKQEAEELLNILQSSIERRDQAIDNERARLRQAKENLLANTKVINELQSTEYAQEQQQLQLDYNMSKLTAWLNNLNIQKRLAIEADQYEKAAEICDQIKAVDEQLKKTNKEREQKDKDELNARVQEKKKELSQQKKEYERLECEIDNNILSILCNSQRELEAILKRLEDKYSNDQNAILIIKELLENELTSLRSQTNMTEESNLLTF
ncbi:hypothetical protein RMCBS344292_11604 [Rhizopus microsporus]|nr:hypothetical protein RMCBS344292_11604 [Rhizopus microsporus]